MATGTLYFVSSVSGTVSTPANALGAADGTFTTDANSNTSWTHRWRLGTISGATPSGTQSVTLRMQKGSNSNDPTVSSVELFQGGASLGTLTLFSGSTTISSTTGQDLVYQFAGSLLADSVDVDIEIVTAGAGGSPSARNAASIDAGTWAIAYSVNYAVAANSGTYAVTGQTATLLKSNVLAAANGSYSITGQTADLLLGFALTADAGSYATTGQAATVDYTGIAANYPIAADAGTYAVTGQTATLLRSKIVTADAGAYSITGQTASITQGFTLGADSGSYGVTGQTAEIVYAAAYELTAEFGSYSLSGQNATIAKTRIVSADAGSYAVTGVAATVSKNSILSAAAGAYSVAGQNASITYTEAGSYTLTADSGSYTSTGQAASVLQGYLLSADSGSYSLNGQTAAVAYTPLAQYELLAAAGIYSLNGRIAAISYSGGAQPSTGGRPDKEQLNWADSYAFDDRAAQRLKRSRNEIVLLNIY